MRILVWLGCTVLILMAAVCKGIDDSSIDYVDGFANCIFYKIRENTGIVQEFYCTGNYLQSISMVFTNITEDMEELTIEIRDSNDKCVYWRSINASQLTVADFHTFPINKQVKKGQLYTLYLSYPGNSEDEFVAIMARPSRLNIPEIGKCMYGNISTGGSIVIKFATGNIISPASLALSGGISIYLFLILGNWGVGKLKIRGTGSRRKKPVIEKSAKEESLKLGSNSDAGINPDLGDIKNYNNFCK